MRRSGSAAGQIDHSATLFFKVTAVEPSCIRTADRSPSRDRERVVVFANRCRFPTGEANDASSSFGPFLNPSTLRLGALASLRLCVFA